MDSDWRCWLCIFCLLVSGYLAHASAIPQAQDSLVVTKGSLVDEVNQARGQLESAMAGIRLQIAQVVHEKAVFQENVGNVLEYIRAFRFLLLQRRDFLKKAAEQLQKYDQTDTTAYARDYWQDFAGDLEQEFAKPEWRVDGPPNDDYTRIIKEYNDFIARLGNSAIKNPMLREVVVQVIQYAFTQPLDERQMNSILLDIASLRRVVSQVPWGEKVFNSLISGLPKIKNYLDLLDRHLGHLQSSVLAFHREAARISAQLDLRLVKLDTLIGSCQVIARNLHSLKDFDATQVRQQLIFLANQNQFIDYEQRVLQSFDGEIESVLSQYQWRAVLAAIARQDPDFGKLDLEKNAYLLYVGAGDLNQRFLLHEERGVPSDYLYAIHSLYAIWLEDNPEEKYQIDMSVELLQSEFELTLAQFKRVWEVRVKAAAAAPEPTLFYYGMKKIHNISSPARLNVAMRRVVTNPEDSISAPIEFGEAFSASYKVHERSLAHISVGIGAGWVDPVHLVIEGGKLKISPRGDKALDEYMYALLNFHLGARDVDRFGQYRRFDWRKFMLQAGVAVSKNPLDKVGVGLGYRLFREVQIDFLYFWLRQPKRSQEVALDGAASVEDAKKQFDKVYRADNFSIGVGLHPQLILRLLGF